MKKDYILRKNKMRNKLIDYLEFYNQHRTGYNSIEYINVKSYIYKVARANGLITEFIQDGILTQNDIKDLKRLHFIK